MQTKVWWKSKTIQGLIITVLALAFPKYAGKISSISQNIFDVIGLVCQIAGIAWAAFGRIKTDGKQLTLTSAPAGN